MKALYCRLPFSPLALSSQAVPSSKELDLVLRLLRLSMGYQSTSGFLENAELVKDAPLYFVPRNHFFDFVFLTASAPSADTQSSFWNMLEELGKPTGQANWEVFVYGCEAQTVSPPKGLSASVQAFDAAIINEALLAIDAPVGPA